MPEPGDNGGRLCWEATCPGISRSPMRQWRVRPWRGLLGQGHPFCLYWTSEPCLKNPFCLPGHRFHRDHYKAGTRLKLALSAPKNLLTKTKLSPFAEQNDGRAE